MKSSKFWMALGLVILLAACGGNEETPAPTVTLPPTATTIPTKPAPTVTPSPHPLNGLIYRDTNGLWQVDTVGQAQLLAACKGTTLSPDGQTMAFEQQEDIYLLNLADCSSTNLTNTPNVREMNPMFWEAQPNAIFFGINPQLDAGRPGMILTDGSGYQILDENVSLTSGVAPAPDGIRVAYPSFAGAQIYDFNLQAPTPANPVFFGVEPALVERMDSPAWSPDSSKLAWVARVQDGDSPDGFRLGILVLDFNTLNATILHPYSAVGVGGWPPAPVWSNDGKWLIANIWEQDPALSGLWVMAADGSEEYHIPIPNPNSQWLYQGGPALWSPDGEWVAFSIWMDGNTYWYARVGDWQPIPMGLTADVHLVDWR